MSKSVQSDSEEKVQTPLWLMCLAVVLWVGFCLTIYSLVGNDVGWISNVIRAILR